YQDNIYSRGFNIYTTIDSKEQQQAYEAVRNGILDYTRRAPYPGPEETIDLPDGIESNAEQFDAVLEKIQDKYRDSDDLLVGLVLSAAPDKIVVARSPEQIVEITDKSALKVVARGLA